MEPNSFGGIAEFWDAVRPYWDVAWAVLLRCWDALVELQRSNPQLFSLQTLFGLIGTTVAIWKWWEAREKNLFQKFEAMIERDEAQLVKARNDLLDVMGRPGPGLRIRPPLFAEKALRLVLMRRRWHPISIFRLGNKIDRRLQRAIETSGRKVDAHRLRLSFYMQEIAAARLVQGAVAAGRAAQAHDLAERQRLEQQALDQFHAVLALPGHKENLAALELVAHQQALDGKNAGAAFAYGKLIDLLGRKTPSPSRNVDLARAKRSLAQLRYCDAPREAYRLLADASQLLRQYGPRRERDQLELAETLFAEGIACVRLNMVVRGPERLIEARGHYQDLLSALRTRRQGLFYWMFRTRLFAGHRVREMRERGELGLFQTERFIRLTNRHPRTVAANLQRGNGVRRRNRKPQQPPRGC